MKQPKFEIGDRVTYASPVLPYQKSRGTGKVVWEMVSHYYIVWEDFPSMECPHLKEWELGEDDMLMLVKVADLLEPQTVEPSKIDGLPEIAKPKAKKKSKRKPSLPVGIKVGDNVRNLDNGVVGTVTHLCDRCINIDNPKVCESHNLERSTPRLEILTHPDQAVVFEVGDRVTAASELYSFGRYGMGATVSSKKFDKKKGITFMTVEFDDGYIWTRAVEGSGFFKFLEEPNKLDSFPEITTDHHGYFEHYQPVIKGAKSYWYRRYVYANISGKLVHHHVPNKMVESIETLWRSGATPKEICLALGKNIS